uniref:Uncharacterized protein n=1 Tax=uncultured marine bacterium MedDCM-OCT-S04-C7 TaxID=743059 RepID=D6PD62_9BACT|nr:hypothetical protein [uncultured marine bacterium MedDCM-OCT-S04-C7]
MNKIFFFVFNWQNTATTLEPEIMGTPGNAGCVSKVLGRLWIASHSHGFTKKYLPHVEGEIFILVKTIEKL